MRKINFAEQFEKIWCPHRIINSNGLILSVYVPLTHGVHQTVIHT